MYIPGPQFGGKHKQYGEGSNPLAIHFQNKAEPEPAWNVTRAFRATKPTLWIGWRTVFPFLVMELMSTLCSWTRIGYRWSVLETPWMRSWVTATLPHRILLVVFAWRLLCFRAITWISPFTWSVKNLAQPHPLPPIFTLLASVFHCFWWTINGCLRWKIKPSILCSLFSGMSSTKVHNKAWSVSWPGPLLRMYVLPSDSPTDDSGHTVLSVLVQETSPTGHGNSLKFSHFQHTEFRTDLGPGCTCDHFGTYGLMITDVTAHSTAWAQELHPLSLLSPGAWLPSTQTHIWVSFLHRLKRNAHWNMKLGYESASHDSDIITMGNKARRQICNLSHCPIISKVILWKLRLHSFRSIFFLITHCVLFAQYQNEDKNYNRLIASLESLYIFGALKKEKSKSFVSDWRVNTDSRSS